MVMDTIRACKLVILFIGFLHMQTIAFSSSTGDLNIRCLERERQALVKFKKGLVQDHKQLLSSWVSEEDCCQWSGIRCNNKTGHVIKLDLRSMYPLNYDEDGFHAKPLRGEISPSLLELQHLSYLDLSDNYFGDILIPNFIGSFTKLRYLNLSSAGFGGTVPPQLGNASTLHFLDIGYYLPGSNRLNVDNLGWLSRLSSLSYLDMSYVNLSKAVDWLQTINMLPHLLELRLSYCELPKVVLPSLPSNTSLATFTHSHNNNNSSTFALFFNVSSSLSYLDLAANFLGSGVFRILGNTCKLRDLDLSENDIEGEMLQLFQSWSGCTGDFPLERLRLGGNILTGHLPDFTRLPSLRELCVDDNQLNGTLPESLGQLSNLISLDLCNNSLSGFVSEVHFLGLSRLKELYLSTNSLVLNLSSTWVPPFQLDVLDVSFCKLGPRFPMWLHTQKTLLNLDISNAGISDSIPDWFWALSPNLTRLKLSHNQINGQLPNLSLKFFYLAEIDLSSNQLEGPLPQFSSKVELLDLSKNLFSGSISSLCKMHVAYKSLSYLDLSANLLSGELPDCWMYWKHLIVLNLADNNLSGQVPRSMGSLTFLRTLHLANNSLSGELPLSLQNCSRLISLDLGENILSGLIPTWIGESLPNLMFLYLRSNEFYGHIPPQLCHLIFLQILDLAQNNISGSIPRCLYNLSAMSWTESSSRPIIFKESDYHTYVEKGRVVWKGKEVEYSSILPLVKRIDLSNNKLSGEIPIELTTLFGLQGLNLSRNHLFGNLVSMISHLWQLESLDLSRNQLSGVIPPTLSNLTLLSQLDLSYNDFVGKIPLGTQLQSFNASSYAGNRELCGPPLAVKCPHDEISRGPLLTGVNEGDGFDYKPWFYVSMGLGFVVGFWGACGTLLLSNSFDYFFLRLFDYMKDRLFVTRTVHVVIV